MSDCVDIELVEVDPVAVTVAEDVVAVAVDDSEQIAITVVDDVISLDLVDVDPVDVTVTADEVVVALVDAAIVVELGETGPPGPPGPPGGSGEQVLLTLTAGEVLGGHRAVVVQGEAYLADPADPAHASRALLVTTGAAGLGQPVQAVGYGELIEPSWAWLPDVPVWYSAGGVLTQTPPTSGHSRVVGMPSAPTVLFVAPEPALFIA